MNFTSETVGSISTYQHYLLHHKESQVPGLVHWEDPEGSGREGGGRGDPDAEYM